jgi:hypothetical protein
MGFKDISTELIAVNIPFDPIYFKKENCFKIECSGRKH